jgi:hypothetical protein
MPSTGYSVGQAIRVPDGRIFTPYSNGGNVKLRIGFSSSDFAETPRGSSGSPFYGSFYYNGYIYALGTDGSKILGIYKINTTTAEVTLVKSFGLLNIADSTTYPSFLAFDGSDYILTAFSAGDVAVYLYSYRISTGAFTGITLPVSGTPQGITGLGISGATVYCSYIDGSSYKLVSAAVSGGTATTILNGSDIVSVGWKGYHIQGNAIYNAARSANFTIDSNTLKRLFILDNAADWKMLLLYPSNFSEQEGATVKSSGSYSAISILGEWLIFPFRSDEAVEYSANRIEAGSSTKKWLSLASSAKEVC